MRNEFRQPHAAVRGALPPVDWDVEHSYNGPSPRSLAAASASVQASSEVPTDAYPQPEPLFSGPRNRMPYFRWLGPTAIMPGFKQMVVKVKRQDTDVARSSTDGGAAAAAAGMAGSPGLMSTFHASSMGEQRNAFPSTPGTGMESENRTPLNLPFYDTSPIPPSELITHLANTFFTHLGCNYPFLQRERFLRDLEEKQVDAILVDAVCAIAARFSTHPLLTQQAVDESKTTPAEYGHAFAQRAQTALVDTFSCPTVAAVQAALLLAYIEFGESRDSGLWMYLGISIRMAQDLGLHKIEGLKYRGRTGPTPKLIKRESMSGSPEIPAKPGAGEKVKRRAEENQREQVVLEGAIDAQDQADDPKAVAEQKAVEQERVDTFWAVFFLDKMVSSGTGRRGTLRDKDIELSFPSLETTDPKSGWPTVFPALIRIVHLYGRVADLLNSLKEISDITTETPKRLASMESHVTNFYSGLSPRLHFDAVNFQHYMKAGEGTNFVLLHFWFHTLIVLLHQPTLLMTFGGRMLQLFPNSRQLSMSSAKTIADILSYSQLMDAKASLGNPFTTQPIYIAACAFLKETAEQTASSTAQSRASSPTRKERATVGDHSASMNGTPTSRKRLSIHELTTPVDGPTSDPGSAELRRASTVTELQKSSDKSSEGTALSAAKTANAVAKHTLLATAATQHYQLCYKALQSLETYWAGTKYILTVLDQKFQGVGDPLLYTVEEGNSAMEVPRPEPAFTSPGWRRKLSWGPYLYGSPGVGGVGAQELWNEKAIQIPGSPAGGLGTAIGWTMTGTMNSPSTSLAWHYPSGGAGMNMNGGLEGHSNGTASQGHMDFTQHNRTESNNLQQQPDLMAYPNDGSNADLLLPTHNNGGTAHPNHNAAFPLIPTPNNTNTPDYSAWGSKPCIANWPFANNLWSTNSNSATPGDGSVGVGSSNEIGTGVSIPFGDMMIESQDVDMSMLGLEMMPWFESWTTGEGLWVDPGGGHGHAGGPGAEGG